MRILVGEVDRIDLAERLFAEVPVVQDDADFNCVEWVRLALLRLKRDRSGGVRVVFDWEDIQSTALEYVDLKKKQGRFEVGWEGDSSRVATFDMMLDREIVA